MPAKNKKKTPSPQGVAKELNALGKMIEQLVRDAAGSSHIRGVRSDVSEGVRNVGRRLHAAIEDAKKSEQGAKLKTQARMVFLAGKKESLQKTRRLRADIARGLKAISRELDRVAGTIEK